MASHRLLSSCRLQNSAFSDSKVGLSPTAAKMGAMSAAPSDECDTSREVRVYAKL